MDSYQPEVEERKAGDTPHFKPHHVWHGRPIFHPDQIRNRRQLRPGMVLVYFSAFGSQTELIVLRKPYQHRGDFKVVLYNPKKQTRDEYFLADHSVTPYNTERHEWNKTHFFADSGRRISRIELRALVASD